MDPKIKPRICINEGCYNECAKGNTCPNCQLKALQSKKTKQISKWTKKPKTELEKAISKAERGIPTAEKLYEKALKIWSEIVRGDEPTVICSTCPKEVKTRGGLFGAHAGHFLDKANHWKISLDPMDGLPQCKTCNVDFKDNPKRLELIKFEMRQTMVKIYGSEAVEDLENRGAEFRIAVKQGRENSKPRTHDPLAEQYGRPTDMEWLQEKIFELKEIKRHGQIYY